MSCPSSQNPLILTVSMGALPEGFCPANLQELANAIAQRIIIAPSESSLNIVGGGTEPASNVGPWFKNCEQLFVFDDTLARYRPIEKGGFNSLQVFSASGDFVVPDNVFKIMVEGWGGGGGGCNNGGVSGGGSAGAFGLSIKTVVPGQVVPITIGLGGAPGNPGTAGGTTTVLGMTLGGGAGGLASGEPVLGGVYAGADFGIEGGTSYRSASTPGQGGDAPRGGAGGQFSGVDATFGIGTTPAGGGCGSTAAIAGQAGAPGQVIVWF